MKKCLIVVDYQNDFVSGSLGFKEAVDLEMNIANKIESYRSKGDDILFTFDTHYDDYLKTQEGANLPIAHCLYGDKGHNLYGKVAELIKDSDKRFYKTSFGSDELYEYLKKLSYESIELVGVVSNICVISNAVLAKTAQPETPILVDFKCIASNDENLNLAAVAIMESLQIKVYNK